MNPTVFVQESQGKNYFEILGVGLNATTKEIRKARRDLLSEMHPDSVDKSLRDDAIKATAIINEAFEALTDKDFAVAYIDSGFTLKHGEEFETEKVAQSGNEKVLASVNFTKRKGLPAVGQIAVAPSTLVKGGGVTVKNVRSGGDKLKDRKVNIVPHTHNLTINIYPNLGLSAEGNDLGESQNETNGDLIVYVVPKQGIDPNELAETFAPNPFKSGRLPLTELELKAEYLGINLGESESLFHVNKQNGEISSFILAQ